jgi:hypothetical protein
MCKKHGYQPGACMSSFFVDWSKTCACCHKRPRCASDMKSTYGFCDDPECMAKNKELSQQAVEASKCDKCGRYKTFERRRCCTIAKLIEDGAPTISIKISYMDRELIFLHPSVSLLDKERLT